MKAGDVLAVVVSYNGLHETSRGVDALRGQVGHVHIVDNGSGADSLAILDTLERHPNVTVERLVSNRGVGHALNLGLKRARELGYSWLLTMDQDSVVDGSMVMAYASEIERHPDRVCLAPTLAEATRAGEPEHARVKYAITSGNLVRVDVCHAVGAYDAGLFIDSIDFDFSLRLRMAGYSIFRVRDAVMHHRVGEPTAVPRYLRRLYSQHAPVRRYYITRNFLYLAERHVARFPAFILKLGLVQVVQAVLVGAFDPTPRPSYRAMAQGLRDYAARKVGPYMPTD